MAASVIRFACRGRNLLQSTLYIAPIENRRMCHEYVPFSPPYTQHPEESMERKYPEVEVCSEDYQFVERLIPPETIPPPPEHEKYPTPSGWFPPDVSKQPAEYKIQRSRNHVLPVYLQTYQSGRVTTVLKFVYGDIWKLDAEIKKQLGIRLSQVHEVGRFIRFKGNYVENVANYLLRKGF